MVAKPPFMRPSLTKTSLTCTVASNGKEKVVKKDRLTKYFEEKGLTVQDLPKAILCHELMGIFMLALTWSSCYYFPPSQNRFLKEPIAKMLAMVPKTLSGPVTSNAFLSSRIGTSYLESSCLRKLIRPITLPSKLFLTYKLVQLLPNLPFFGAEVQPAIRSGPTPDAKANVKGQSGLLARGGSVCMDTSDAEYNFRSYHHHRDCPESHPSQLVGDLAYWSAESSVGGRKGGEGGGRPLLLGEEGESGFDRLSSRIMRRVSASLGKGHHSLH